MPQNLDLSTIFSEITKTLVANQKVLNQADKTNHNHGDNMVQTFQTAQQAVAAEKGKPASQQLEYAAERLKQTTQSGSGQIYAQGLERAAQKFQGKSLTSDTIGTLIEALMGSSTTSQTQRLQSQPSQGGGDLLTSLLGSLVGGQPTQQSQQQQVRPSQNSGGSLTDLLGGLMGGDQQTQQNQAQPQQSQGSGDLLTSLLGGLMGGGGSSSQQSQSTPEDLIGSLLSGLSGGSTNTNQSNGMDAGDLLSAALRYYASKKSGRSSLEAITSALSKSSPLGGTPERTQSGALVIQTLMKMLGKSQ